MITERSNARTNLFQWIAQAKRSAISEKAEHTAEHLQDHSEAIFAMAASSPSAPAHDMRKLLARDDFERVATRYMVGNWFLNVGMPEKTLDEARKDWFPMAQSAMETLRTQFPPKTPLTGKGISDQIEAIAGASFRTAAGFASGQGHGTPVLLREALGLPGDHEVCVMETRPEILLNAADALIALGVRLDLHNRKTVENAIPNAMIDALAKRFSENAETELRNANIEFNTQPECSETCGELYQGARAVVRKLPRSLTQEEVLESMAAWFSDPTRLYGEQEGSVVYKARLDAIVTEVRFLTPGAPAPREPEDNGLTM